MGNWVSRNRWFFLFATLVFLVPGLVMARKDLARGRRLNCAIYGVTALLALALVLLGIMQS